MLIRSDRNEYNNHGLAKCVRSANSRVDIFVSSQQNPVNNSTYEHRMVVQNRVNCNTSRTAIGIQSFCMQSRQVISQFKMALKLWNRTASRKKRHEQYAYSEVARKKNKQKRPKSTKRGKLRRRMSKNDSECQ